MYGLAKIAEEAYERYYREDPELTRLWQEDMKATEQYKQDKDAVKDVRRKALLKGGLIGGGMGSVAGLGLDLLLGRRYHTRLFPPAALTGLGAGGSLGRLIAGQRFDGSNPLALTAQESAKAADEAQLRHLERWIYNDEQNAGAQSYELKG